MNAKLSLMLVIALGWGCGGSSPRAEVAPSPAQETAVEAPPAPPPSDGTISRAELLPILDAGLGRFLQGVDVEAVREAGKFVGFRIVRLWPEDPRFADAAVRPGDVVVRVNGQAIERPEQALAAWNGLRVASELVVSFLRDGQWQEARFPITD